jgi:multicomponent Na+:H+ antiporter subunit G
MLEFEFFEVFDFLNFTVIRLYVSYFFLLLGVFAVFVGMIGLIRLPDIYNRLHATTKIATLGAFLVLFSILIRDGFTPFGLKAIAVGVFLLMTTPVAGHVIARVAYNAGIPPCDQTIFDAYSGKRQGDYCDDYDFHEGSYTFLNLEAKEKDHEYSDQYIENLTEQFSREIAGLAHHVAESDDDLDDDMDEEEEDEETREDSEFITGVESAEKSAEEKESNDDEKNR